MEQQQKTRYKCMQVSTMVKYYVWEQGGGTTEEVQSEHKPERYLCWNYIRGKFKCYTKDLKFTMQSSGTPSISVTKGLFEGHYLLNSFIPVSAFKVVKLNPK